MRLDHNCLNCGDPVPENKRMDVKGNIRVISNMANLLKSNATI